MKTANSLWRQSGLSRFNQTYCNGNAQPRQGDFRAAQPNTLDLPEIRHV
jgi:hypothetical protein